MCAHASKAAVPSFFAGYRLLHSLLESRCCRHRCRRRRRRRRRRHRLGTNKENCVDPFLKYARSDLTKLAGLVKPLFTSSVTLRQRFDDRSPRSLKMQRYSLTLLKINAAINHSVSV